MNNELEETLSLYKDELNRKRKEIADLNKEIIDQRTYFTQICNLKDKITQLSNENFELKKDKIQIKSDLTKLKDSEITKIKENYEKAFLNTANLNRAERKELQYQWNSMAEKLKSKTDENELLKSEIYDLKIQLENELIETEFNHNSIESDTCSDVESVNSHVAVNNVDLSYVEYERQGQNTSFLWNGMLQNTRDKRYEKITLMGTVFFTLFDRIG